MDKKDLEILELLQKSGRISLSELKKHVGLSLSSIAERLKKLESEKVIKEYRAILNESILGIDITAFVEVLIKDPSFEKNFISSMKKLQEVLECHYVTGEFSCLLKIKTRTKQRLKHLILDQINSHPGVERTKTIMVLDTPKETSILPLQNSQELT